MTQTAAQTRVAELLREIEHRSDTPLLDAIHSRAREALRALGDEGAEEWTALEWNLGQWVVRQSYGDMVIHCRDEATARRIAALPRLERAAREVLRVWCHTTAIELHARDGVNLGADNPFAQLRAALDEPGGQP